MEELTEKLKNRKISDSSLKIYQKNINKLSRDITGKDFKNTDFLKKYDDVIKHLEEKTISTRKNYLASILVAISPEGRGKYSEGSEKVGKKYTEYLLELAKEYDKKMSEQKKSDKNCDFLVIGAGIAGLYYAIKLSEYYKTNNK